MNIWYKQLFEVNIGHDYYNDDLSPDFGFFASVETQRLMRNFGMVMKPAASGFKVFCKLDSNLSTDVQMIAPQHMDVPFKLVFGMHLKNALFNNYTNLPDVIAPRQAFYLNNRTNVSGSSPGNMLLGESQSTGGHVGANDLAFVVDDNFRWSFPADSVPNPTIDITWSDSAGTAVLQETFEKDDQARVQAVFEKLFEIPDGLYQISTAPNVAVGNRRVFKHPSLGEAPPFGVIEILSHPDEAQNSFREDVVLTVNAQPLTVTQLNARNYFVRFERRSLPWRYRVVRNNPSINLADWSLQYGALQSPFPAGAIFTGSPADANSTQREFVSDIPLPFFQTPKRDIQLHAPGIQPLNHLPNPAPSSIRKDNSGNLYAESIIYI